MPRAPAISRHLVPSLDTVAAWLLALIWISPLLVACWAAFHHPVDALRFDPFRPWTMPRGVSEEDFAASAPPCPRASVEGTGDRSSPTIGAQAPLAALVALLWVCVATLPLSAANAIALAIAASGEHRGSGSAIIGVLQFVLAGAVSTLIGALHNGTAYPMTLAILVCSALASLVCLTGGHGQARTQG
jgi:hypothetical protein